MHFWSPSYSMFK